MCFLFCTNYLKITKNLSFSIYFFFLYADFSVGLYKKLPIDN